MHEVAAVQGAVRTAVEYMQATGASRVTNVQLSMTVSGHFTEDVVRQYFAAFTVGTPAAEATLTIAWFPAHYQCLSCLHTFQSLQPAVEALCPVCGDLALEIHHQDICAVSAIDVALDENGTQKKRHLIPGISLENEAPSWQA
jgi:Zn finger protein HypA/HybF involved in hydrogenase expression